MAIQFLQRALPIEGQVIPDSKHEILFEVCDNPEEEKNEMMA